MSVEQPPLWEMPAEQARVRTWLWPSVVAAALCFLPLGIIAIIYAIRADSARARGEVDLAKRRARVARRWFIATVIVGLLVEAVIVAAFMGLGARG